MSWNTCYMCRKDLGLGEGGYYFEKGSYYVIYQCTECISKDPDWANKISGQEETLNDTESKIENLEKENINLKNDIEYLSLACQSLRLHIFETQERIETILKYLQFLQVSVNKKLIQEGKDLLNG